MKLFIITKKTKEKEEPVNAFFEENFEKAKLYFQGFCWGDSNQYNLRMIGKFEKNTLKINTCNIFITASWQTNKKTEDDHKSIKQLKMKYDYILNKNKVFKEVIKDIFDGVEVGR